MSGDIHSLRSGQALPTTAKYVWEGNNYYSPLIYSMLGGTWRYHMYDGLGSTRQLMLHASPYTVTDTYSYEAFGNLFASTGTTPNLARSRPPVGGRDRHGGAARPHLATYRFGAAWGYITDTPGSGLLQLGARYYWPELGRFIQQDPLGDGVNWYAYADNNPVTTIDPEGLIVDTAMDAAFAVWDVGTAIRCPNWKTIGLAAVSVVAVAVPFVPNAVGAARHSAEIAEFLAKMGARYGGGEAARIARLIQEAEAKYPKLAGIWHGHHVDPKHLFREMARAIRERIPAAYHQLIHNEVRARWAYGKGAASLSRAQEIMGKVYRKLLLP